MSDVLHEQVCFEIADDLSDGMYVPAVLSAIQTYQTDSVIKNDSWNKLYKKNRQYSLDIFVVGVKPEYNFLFDRCVKRVTMRPNQYTYKINPRMFDMYTRISLERIYEMSKVTNRSLAQLIGIIIGSNAMALPNLTELFPAEVTSSQSGVIFECGEHTGFDAELSYTYDNVLPSMLTRCLSHPEEVPERHAELIAKCVGYVGRRGFGTYLASAYKKPVLEICNKKDFNLLTKWQNPNYVPVIVDDGDFRPGINRALNTFSKLLEDLPKTLPNMQSVLDD